MNYLKNRKKTKKKQTSMDKRNRADLRNDIAK